MESVTSHKHAEAAQSSVKSRALLRANVYQKVKNAVANAFSAPAFASALA